MKQPQRKTRHWVLLLLSFALLILSGCSTRQEPKPVLHINIRPSSVEAQTTSRNMYATYNVAPPAATDTPLPLALPTDESIALETVASTPTPVSPPLPTPLPLLVPIGRPERIVIPDVDVDTAIESVYAQQNQVGDQWFQHWNTAAYAAGYHESSALLGQPGNTVISGHNNIDGAVFRNLYQVQPGTTLQLYANGFRYDYIVEDQFIVREAGVPLEQRLQNASWIQTTVDERVTLVSCWPPESNEYRVIVVARPVGGQAAGGR